jgi:hypothetical protein
LGTDGSFSEFHIETEDPNNLFKTILSLGSGNSLSVTSDNRSFYESVFTELGNSEMILSIFKQFEGDLTISNVIDKIIPLSKIGLCCDEVIAFIASHFYEIPSTSFEHISDSIVESILSHSDLQIMSEDSLYEFIISRIRENCNSLNLLEFVKFEYLSTDNITMFCDLSQDFYDQLNQSIWSGICIRLLQAISPTSSSSRTKHQRKFISLVPDVNNPLLGGVISFLTARCNGNVSDKGIVVVTSSSQVSNDTANSPKNAADLTASSYFHSANQANQWICYDFGDSRIKPTHYLIRSNHVNGSGGYHPKSWVVEGSVDCNQWEEIDRRDNNSDLNAQNVVRLFTVTHSSEYRSLRLRQTGPSHSGANYLVISGFDLFGHFFEPQQ